ncbi:MAG: hypothetical protein IPP01_13335, partial [Saprospiraceae bacterium]|nr:hypothetical protein [Saprospiraceae bacterium]
VNEFANPTRALACNDDIQVSLDDSCKATIGADMVLEGGPYGCYDNYIVELRDWATNALVDRCSNQAGAQITCADIGREFKATVIDPATGNKCWGHIRVEDKLAPRIVCPADTCLPCGTSIDPSVTGFPDVTECLASTCVPGFGCGYSLSYRDVSRQGTCALGYDRLITRTWTATDASGNRGTCVQVITVGLGKLLDVTVPLNYDGLEADMLLCNNKIDRVKNFNAHYYQPSHLGVECLDGYILDSVLFKALVAVGADPNYYVNDPFNFGARSPRVLGWNCIDDVTSKYFGHPSPDPVYYPAHPSYDPAQGFPCWGPDVHVMWQGTGRPAANCRNLSTTYEDVVFNLAEAGCDAGPIGCYKVLRKWTVLDWCTGEIGGHSQIIKVADPEGPKVLYPDTILVNMEVWTCTGRWEVPPAWLVDNCSNEIHYTVEVTEGTVLGNEVAGYVVINLPEGVQDAWIIAQDCCGNITRKLVKLNVVDNEPPVPVCRRGTVIALSNNQSTGEGIAKLYAEDVNEGSFDNCKPHVYYKIIRMEELLDGRDRATRNGVLPPYDNRRSCNGLNGDDHPGAAAPGNQVYFDDFTKFCCADVGQTIMVVLRVSDKNPGAGPIHPNTWTNISLQEGHFNDCMVEVEIQDKQPPVIVAPPDMVVSCWFWFDPSEAALENPNDA